MMLPESPHENSRMFVANQSLTGAALTDRLLAFAFDLCLWAPVSLLLTKPLWRDFQYHHMMSPGSTEATIFFGFGLLIALLFMVVVQTLCVWKWGATPGKKIFKLEVVSLSGHRLTLGAALTRAVTQVFEVACLCLPFLEVVSHRERRPWHDRLAESRVITRKQQAFEGPHALETRFFRNLYWGFGLSMLILAFGSMLQMHRQVKLGAMKRADLEDSGYLCEQKTPAAPAREGVLSSQARLDFALAQFEAGALDRDCLEAEADFAIWTQAEELLPWAHLIRGVLRQNQGLDSAGDVDTASYFSKACVGGEDGDSSVLCELSSYFQGHLNTPLTDASWTGQVAQLKQAVERGQFDEVEVLAAKTVWPGALASYVQDLSLKSLYLKNAQVEFESGLKLLTPAMSSDRKWATQAWACFSETTKDCGRKASPLACRNLRHQLETASSDAWTPSMTLTFAFEKTCFNRQDVIVDNEIKRHFGTDPKMAWATELKKSRVDPKVFVEALRDSPPDHWARAYLLWWAGRGQSEASEDLAVEYQRTPRSNPDWWIAYQSFDPATDIRNQKQNVLVPRRGLSSVTETTSEVLPAFEKVDVLPDEAVPQVEAQ